MAPTHSDLAIFYGVRAMRPPPLRARVPHRQQSVAVRRLLASLSARVAAPEPRTRERSSLSHSRAVAAAAIARHGRVGIDVEYMCPRRDIQSIIEAFVGPMDKPVTPAAFYRAWTYGEAHFKAFGTLPDAESIERVMERHADEGVYRVPGPESAAVGVMHSKPFEDFALTIVWEMTDRAGGENRPPACLLQDGGNDTGDAP